MGAREVYEAQESGRLIFRRANTQKRARPHKAEIPNPFPSRCVFVDAGERRRKREREGEALEYVAPTWLHRRERKEGSHAVRHAG